MKTFFFVGGVLFCVCMCCKEQTLMIKHLASLLLCIGVVVPLLWREVDGAVRCDASRACFPMASPSCTRGNNLNLRFFMDAASAYQNSSVEADSAFNNRTITYAFCPRVDELQAFNLTDAPTFSVIDPADNASFVEDVEDVYLSAYGFGESESIAVPSNTSASRVMIAQNGSKFCTGNAVLLVDFLVFQISMTDGYFKYNGAVAPRENVSEVSVQPQGVGFQPTCSYDGVCQLDATFHCIGDVGQQNCAQCITDPYEAANKTVQIWVSYYGTDNNGRRLLSGGSNPLNFRKYAGASVYNTLSNSLDRVSTGQSLDPTLPDALSNPQ